MNYLLDVNALIAGWEGLSQSSLRTQRGGGLINPEMGMDHG